MSSGFARMFCALAAAAVSNGQAQIPAEQPLACEVRPLAPTLTYRLIYRAGYVVTVPLEQFGSEQRTLAVTVRITPKRAGARPLLLRDIGKLPVGSDPAKSEAQVAGGFFLGAGGYQAEMVLTDSQQRICRKRWDLELKPHRGVQSALSPGQLAAFSQLEWPHLEASGAGALTVLLGAGARERNAVLLDSLAAILDRMPFSHVHVVAFSLDQHKELLRQDVAGARGFERVAKALEVFNPATVSYAVLKDPAGHRDFLWQLLAKEGLRAEPADAVLFVGYSTFDDSHIYAPPTCADGSRKTVYAYFDYSEPSRREYRQPGRQRREGLPRVALAQPDMPDAISRITRACSGTVFHVHSPEELAVAVEKVEELVRRK
jgi:hypothetical protein